jgi:hypothetical protein
MSFTLTNETLTGLFYIQRYRYLTINQFAKITESSYDKAASVLRIMERKKILGSFGNVPFGGRGKAPKTYYLTRKGHGFLIDNIDAPIEEVGGYKKVNSDVKWTPKTYHNLALIDCFLAIEKQVSRSNYRLYKVFSENKIERLKGGGTRTETTDFIDDTQSSDSRIIPDGAFILERLEDQKRFLFFLEFDNGTETIASDKAYNYHKTIQYKYSQYVRYLESGKYGLKYQEHGSFAYFSMLFVTDSERRAENISASLEFIKSDYRRLFYLSDFDQATADIFYSKWLLPCGTEADSRPIIKS